MVRVLEMIAPVARLQEARIALAFSAAVLYYALVVAAEVGRTPTIVLSAAPAALALLWWRTRPGLSMALGTTGLLLVSAFALNSYFPENPAQQSAALVAIFGGALSRRVLHQRCAVALAMLAALLVVLWALLGFEGRAGEGGLLGTVLVVLVFAALAAGVTARLLTERGLGMDRALRTARQRGEAAEQDVLIELERNRLAREVHDVVAHSLAVVIAQADGARFAAETKPETVAPALEAISDTARRALGEVRTMLHDLRTSGEGGVVPGAADLAGLVDGVRGLGFEVDETAFGEPRPLDRTTGLALYRVAQEALTNAMRHGDRAEPVGLELDWGARQVVLVVTNAVPPEVVPASERAGHGVTGMRERAADAGGDCSAGIGSNGRFRVRVALPVAEPEPDHAASARGASNPLLALFAPAEPLPRA